MVGAKCHENLKVDESIYVFKIAWVQDLMKMSALSSEPTI